jgi:RNA polymerase sigma factor (sigma-70 family)
MEPSVISLRSEERVPDGQLLERFIFHRDETAFTDLVHRYGTLVLGVCQRVLGDSHQAEDAFQATFLVLVRKARILDRSGPLGNWLYAVAYRTATKARMTAARRRARERQAMYSASEPFSVENQAWDEMRPILDEELSQMPRKYRAPLVLCYLEGKTQQEAAQALGWPSGSMSRRMNRARQLLRDRLEKRGVANSISVGVLFWLLQQKHGRGSPGLRRRRNYYCDRGRDSGSGSHPSRRQEPSQNWLCSPGHYPVIGCWRVCVRSVDV